RRDTSSSNFAGSSSRRFSGNLGSRDDADDDWRHGAASAWRAGVRSRPAIRESDPTRPLVGRGCMNKVNASYLFNLAERYSFFRAGISAFGNTYRAMAPTINLTVGRPAFSVNLRPR